MPEERYTFSGLFDQSNGRGGEMVRECNAILKAQLVVECFLCDDDGYRGTVVCDHVDRTDVVARGMAKVRAALKGRAS